MGIVYDESSRSFRLDTEHTTYVIGIADEEQFVGHAYFGKKLGKDDVTYLLRTEEPPYTPQKNTRDRLAFLDCFPMEYPTGGIGDFRESAIVIRDMNGHRALKLSLKDYCIYKGKKELRGLPATWGNDEDTETLELILWDPNLQIKVILSYSIFLGIDAVVRSVKLVNQGKDTVFIEKIMSASIDMDNEEFEKIILHGSWARERHMDRTPVNYGVQSTSSVRGESGHQQQPFMALVNKQTTYHTGKVYGINLIYSGNCTTLADRGQFDNIRFMTGINPEGFEWKLNPGEEFQSPEAVLVYSEEGLNGMSHTFHDLYRAHLIRGEYRDKKRPILINNWEATYFEFDEKKLLEIANQASTLGIEMLVMDDGWFGNRYDDNRALGDWDVNENKLKGGLKPLVEAVNKLGMKFGIWFEPEMISPDSNLYRAHPDWAIKIPGRTPGLARNQYVLDMSRREVQDYVYEKVAGILHSANIEYVKWDMNRPLCEIGSASLTSECQGELFHRYVLGVYRLQEKLITDFPHLLLENCSGGGARFDAGMLYYSPQIWCSDDTDAIERLSIQEGTALIYPLSAMGAHVSDCPNHTLGRTTPFETRGYVALAGTFGYELDVTKISSADREMIPAQVSMYHKYNDLIRTGDYYRIASYQENHMYDCYMVFSKNKGEALVTYIQVMARPNSHSRRILLHGLDPDKTYRLEGEKRLYLGSTLMQAGVLIENIWGDFKGRLLYLKEESC